jgi:hypothetical protein
VSVLLIIGGLILWLGAPVVCFLKGKVGLGLFGIIGIIAVVGWIAAWVGAVRLATPGSWWARNRYSGEKLARSRARFPEDARIADAETEETKAAWSDEEIDTSGMDRITRRALRKAGRL